MVFHSPLTADWIWHRQDSYTPYHQVILARKTFRLAQPSSALRAPLGAGTLRAPLGGATLKIAVDGGYRLFVNGEWVADGPARSWPEHFQYDLIEVGPYLVAGRNELAVIARHWQTGDFHTRPQQAGLLVQLEVRPDGGKRARRIVSDASWETAWLEAWAGDTPKASIQMEPQELYDARLDGRLVFTPAAVLYPAEGGPWGGLHPRDVALLTRQPVHFQRFAGANRVKRRTDLHFCLPAVRLAHPGAVEANRYASANTGMVTTLELAAPAAIQLAPEGMLAAIDGAARPDGRYDLPAGRHSLAAFAWPIYGHRKERSLRIVDPPAGLRLLNPLDAAAENPWALVELPKYGLLEDDLAWDWFAGPEGRREEVEKGYRAAVDKLLEEKEFHRRGAEKEEKREEESKDWRGKIRGEEVAIKTVPAEEMFVRDTHWAFAAREVIGGAGEWVEGAGALIHDNAGLTTVRPAPGGDVELVYDLGAETVGYFDFELLAPAEVTLDLYAVEYIRPDGTVQHTGDNHNGLRYITRAGLNHFTSLKRRAGRYLFLTLRNLSAPVQIRLLRVIESTYPVEAEGGFACSDARLDKIWEISARTLKLCMEDTFTDCPLYEQTFWVGDSRNEALFAYDTFGASDIALRGLRLAAQSLARYPLAGGQVPSSWDMVLPAWSFLWGIAVWDYYFYTGQRAALEELWPAVVRNLENAEQLLNERGLFSGKFWNMFDWTPVDDRQETVLHNSFLMIGAVDAAQKMAAVLGDGPRGEWLAGLRAYLVAALDQCWDEARQAYPDSIHADGSPSDSTCMHTSFLALLYDAYSEITTEARAPRQGHEARDYGEKPEKVEKKPGKREALVKNVLKPPEGMVRVGSPFAIHYLYEALDKIGQAPAILDSIYENYLPMLAEGASTVWEVFPTSGDHPGGFPTRSHCHAWSAAPLHFLPQIVLGIRASAPGGAAYTVSPWPGELEWASGAVCTARGRLEVSWRKEGKRLAIQVKAPDGVEVKFESNPSLEGLEVIL